MCAHALPDRFDDDCASINFIFMWVKSDKTFEEIVERLVALFKPLDARDDDDLAQASSPEPSPAAPGILISTPFEDDPE